MTGRAMLIADRAGRFCLEQPQQLSGFFGLCADAFLGKQLARPARMERKGRKK
jgi:hypothetical protein